MNGFDNNDQGGRGHSRGCRALCLDLSDEEQDVALVQIDDNTKTSFHGSRSPGCICL